MKTLADEIEELCPCKVECDGICDEPRCHCVNPHSDTPCTDDHHALASRMKLLEQHVAGTHITGQYGLRCFKCRELMEGYPHGPVH